VSATSAHHPPAYPLYLGLASKLGYDSVEGMRLASSLLGAGVIVAVGFVGLTVGGRAVGLVAAAIASVYPAFWINDISLMSEPMATLAACLCILASFNLWRRRSVPSAVLLGLAGGFAGLCRSEGPFIVAVSAVALLLGMIGVAWPHRVKLLAVTGVVGLLVMAPWLIRNRGAFEHPVGLTSTSGQSLFLTNGPDTYYGQNLGSKSGYIALNARSSQMFRKDQSVIDQQLRKDVTPFIHANLGRLPVVVLARFGREWNIYRPFDGAANDALVERRGRAPSLVGLWFYWALLPFAIAGGFILFRRRVVLSPLLSVVAAAMIAGMANFGATRYRAGAEVTLVVLASVALTVVGRPAGRRVQRELRAVARRLRPSSTAPVAAPTAP